MDLLKSGKRLSIKASLISFTFQYGSTQIGMIVAGIDDNEEFTFQYGSTQIEKFLK